MGTLTNAGVGFHDLECLGDTKIAFGRECQGMTFRSERKMSEIKLSMNGVPTNTSTAKLGTMLNQTRMKKLPKLTCRDYLVFHV